MQVLGLAARKRGDRMRIMRFKRKPIREDQVTIRITHCGVCHSDLHFVNNDWKKTIYPCVPGHEIIGEVTETGDKVSRFKVGDRVGVGCMINSCQVCEQCVRGEEQYCTGPKGHVEAYNGPVIPDGTNTYGGYSTYIMVREQFVLSIPDALSSAEAAPLLCAGITVYSAMKYHGLQAGQTVGVAGIGGLGHMAIKLAKMFGARVIALTYTPSKTEDLLAMGADEVISMRDRASLRDIRETLDLLLHTVPYPFDPAPYIELMKESSTFSLLGNLIGFPPMKPEKLALKRISLAGSWVGGIAETQELLNVCAEKGIQSDVHVIGIDEVDEAFERLLRRGAGNVRFRHVIDMETLHEKAPESSSEEEE